MSVDIFSRLCRINCEFTKYAYVSMHAYAYIWIYIYIYIYTYNMHAYEFMYIYTYIHTYSSRTPMQRHTQRDREQARATELTWTQAICTVAHDFTRRKLSHTGRHRRKICALKAAEKSQHLTCRLHLWSSHQALANRTREPDRHVRHDLYSSRKKCVHLIPE